MHVNKLLHNIPLMKFMSELEYERINKQGHFFGRKWQGIKPTTYTSSGCECFTLLIVAILTPIEPDKVSEHSLRASTLCVNVGKPILPSSLILVTQQVRSFES